jgi:hypothetical protein
MCGYSTLGTLATRKRSAGRFRGSAQKNLCLRVAPPIRHMVTRKPHKYRVRSGDRIILRDNAPFLMHRPPPSKGLASILQSGRFNMSKNTAVEMISRRRMLGILGAGVAFGMGAPAAVLTASEAEAQAPGAQAPGAQAPGAQAPGAQAPGAQAPGAQTPGVDQRQGRPDDGTERRQERRSDRTNRRVARRKARKERAVARQEGRKKRRMARRSGTGTSTKGTGPTGTGPAGTGTTGTGTTGQRPARQ